MIDQTRYLQSDPALHREAQQVLLRISQSIISTLEYEKVLQIISDGMSELLGIETAAIYLQENENEMYLGATTPPLDPNMPDSLRKVQLNDHPHLGISISTAKPHLVPDMKQAELTPAEASVVELRKLRSLLFLPFVQESQVIGVLILGTSNSTRVFTQPEIDLGETVANQLSVGIQNARLHHDLQTKNRQLEQEILERKQAQQEAIDAHDQLEKSEHLYRTLFDQAAEGIFLMNHQGMIIQANKAYAEMHGYSIREILGMNISEMDIFGMNTLQSHPEIKNQVDKGLPVRIEVSHRHKDGHQFPLSVIIQTLELGEDNYLLCFHQDLTQQKMIEEELRKHRDNLEELVREKTSKLDQAVEDLQQVNEQVTGKNKIIRQKNRELKKTLDELKKAQTRLIRSEKMASLGILTAGVAHEINNPLNYIMGAYLALVEYFRHTECANREHIDRLLFRLKTGLDKSTAIVQGLNQFSRDIKTLDELCDIHNVLDNCLTMLNNQFRYRIDIKKKYADCHVSVSGNVGQLHQAFLNILTNALQAIPEEGTISISTYHEGDKVCIEITDTGIGISKSDLPKITDPFFTTKEPGKGTGLGLSITYNIIKEHSGTLEFKSERMKGTTVLVTLPSN